MLARHRPLLRRLTPLLVIGIATWAYVSYGFEGAFPRDDALYAHCGQRVADGHLPYEQVFDVTGPLASTISAVGVLGARQAGVPDYRGVQVEGVIIAVLTVLAVYLLTSALTGSVLAGGLAAVTFVGFAGFIDQAATCHPKLFCTLTMTLALLCMVQQRWVLGGLLVAAAALTWQPMALVGLAGLVAVFGGNTHRRWRAFWAFAGGGLALVSVVVGWFALNGSLELLVNAAVLSPLYMGERAENMPLTWHFWRPIRWSFERYMSSVTTGWLGLIGLGAAFIEELRASDGPWQALIGSRWTPVFCTFLLLTGFTIYDFQSADDAYVLLPFLAVGLGYVLIRSVDALTGPASLIRPGWRPVAAGLVALALMMPTVMKVKFHRADGLDEQMRAVDEILARAGDGQVQCINTPEVLLLGEIANPTRHVVVGENILSYIDAREPGGVEGWIRKMDETGVEVVVENQPNAVRMPEVSGWISESFRLWREYGIWNVYVRPDGASTDSTAN